MSTELAIVEAFLKGEEATTVRLIKLLSLSDQLQLTRRLNELNGVLARAQTGFYKVWVGSTVHPVTGEEIEAHWEEVL